MGGKDGYVDVCDVPPGTVDARPVADRKRPLWQELSKRTDTPEDEMYTVVCLVIGRSADGRMYSGGVIEGQLDTGALLGLDDLHDRVHDLVCGALDSRALKEKPS